MTKLPQVGGEKARGRVPTMCTQAHTRKGRTRPPHPGGRRLTPGPSQVCAVAEKEGEKSNDPHFQTTRLTISDLLPCKQVTPNLPHLAKLP